MLEDYDPHGSGPGWSWANLLAACRAHHGSRFGEPTVLGDVSTTAPDVIGDPVVRQDRVPRRREHDIFRLEIA